MKRTKENFDMLLTYSKSLEEGMYRILEANRLDLAKEIAAETLEEDVEEYLQELEEIDFLDNDFDGDLDYSLLDEDY